MKRIHAGSMLMTVPVIVLALHACDQSSNEKNEQAKAAIIKANNELFIKGNLDYADAIFAVEYGGQGPSRIKDFISATRSAFSDLEIKIDRVITDGDVVAWQRTTTGKHIGDYAGRRATFKKVTWRDMILTRYDAEGKVAEEWGVSNLKEMLDAASDIDGVYEYLPPLKGQSVNRNGRFVYMVGPSDGKGAMIGQAGIQTLSGDTVKNVITFCTDAKQIGAEYWWRIASYSGDTATYELIDQNGRVTGGGRAIRIGN